MKKIFKISTLFIAFAMLFVCSCSDSSAFLTDKQIADEDVINGKIVLDTTVDANGNLAERDIHVEIAIELYYSKAPNTVNNFITLAKDFYSKKDAVTTIDTYEENNAIFGGSIIAEYEKQDGVTPEKPTSTPNVSCGYNIVGEMFENGWERNDNLLEIGSLYMTLTGTKDFDSAANRFAISLRTESGNNENRESKRLAIFGKVTSVVLTATDTTTNIPVVYDDNSLYINEIGDFLAIGETYGNPVYITSITFDSHADLGKVKKIK